MRADVDVDYHLQPIVKEVPSYVQDTTDPPRKIKQNDFVLDNSDLILRSLYTNIPYAEGIKSVKTSLENYSKRTASWSIYHICNAITNTKQLYFQLQRLLTDKRLCHRDNLRTLIRKHLYGQIRKKIRIFIYQDIFTDIPQVYRRYIFLNGQVVKQI